MSATASATGSATAAKRLEILRSSSILSDLNANTRAVSPGAIYNFQRCMKIHPNTQLWAEDGFLRHNQSVPKAPGAYLPNNRGFALVVSGVTFGVAIVSHVLFFSKNKKIEYNSEYKHYSAEQNAWSPNPVAGFEKGQPMKLPKPTEVKVPE